MSNDGLRRGDLAEVRKPSEILATLDERGALAGLPFMPEMAAFCGRRFVVDRRMERSATRSTTREAEGSATRFS
jgi:hypothetical protein